MKGGSEDSSIYRLISHYLQLETSMHIGHFIHISIIATFDYWRLNVASCSFVFWINLNECTSEVMGYPRLAIPQKQHCQGRVAPIYKWMITMGYQWGLPHL